MTGIVTMDNRTLFLVNTSQCPTATDEELDFLEQVSVFASFVVVAVIVGKVGVHGLVIAIIFSIFTIGDAITNLRYIQMLRQDSKLNYDIN